MAVEVHTPCGSVVTIDNDVCEALGERSLSLGSHGYAQMWDGEVRLLHRWIVGMDRGAGRAAIVDHINGDPLDCRRGNLRVVDPTTSNLNRGVKGRCVYRTRSGKWEAKVSHRGQIHRLGIHEDPADAERAVADFRERHGIVHRRFVSTPKAS